MNSAPVYVASEMMKRRGKEIEDAIFGYVAIESMRGIWSREIEVFVSKKRVPRLKKSVQGAHDNATGDVEMSRRIGLRSVYVCKGGRDEERGRRS
mmetsp:Transcript_24407/g.79724  ORF Transcript_24407/g.79724 Transcript_24407/m.79724 type:complete len:95 (+) Transcript_24407:3679-3963(+)